METYSDVIKQVTNCEDDEVDQVEDLMRNVIFKSTLDWQTREEFENGARIAYLVLQSLEAETAS